MHKFTASECRNATAKLRCPDLPGNGSAFLAVSVCKVGATEFFCCAAPVGARQAWLRYRAEVRGMSRNCGSRSAQIGVVGTPTAACVGLIGRCVAEQRRSKDRACWRPCLQSCGWSQQHGHLASDRKNWALTPFVNSVLPGLLMGGTRPIDAATIQLTAERRLQYGQAKKGAGS